MPIGLVQETTIVFSDLVEAIGKELEVVEAEAGTVPHPMAFRIIQLAQMEELLETLNTGLVPNPAREGAQAAFARVGLSLPGGPVAPR